LPKIKTAWFEGLTPEEQDKMRQNVLSSEKVLDKLIKICYNNIIELQNVQKSDYNSPSWIAEQAHRNGEVAALNRIIKICTITSDT